MLLRRSSLPLPLVALLLLLGAAPAHAANDHGFSLQWHLHIIGAETAWPTGTGLGITIAVVDTGVDLQHPDLRDKVVPGRNFVTPGAPAQDDHGHGTHVAGIAAASTNNSHGVAGVAADARILPVKVLAHDGKGPVAQVAEGIEWAADNGAAVINISLGVEKPQDGQEPLLPLDDDNILDAVRYASKKGAVCVLAAGNDPNADSAYATERALVVGATDKNDNLATYSSAIGGAAYGLVAPGGSGAEGEDRLKENVLSTYWVDGSSDSYAWAAGTSMAAPHVAGAAAILRGLGLTAVQTMDRIAATAKDLGDPGKDNRYGHGRLDVAKAVSGFTPVETRSATGAPSKTPTTQLRTTATTRTAPRRPTPTTAKMASPTTSASPEGSSTTMQPVFEADMPPDDLPGASAADPSRTDQAGDDGLPWGPPLAATALLGGAVVGLARTRRV